jgi:hypothetical protein
VLGRLTVSGDTLESLQGLAAIEEVRGVLAFDGTKLPSLDGLDALTYVGGLYFADNAQLADLGELEHVGFADNEFTTESSDGEPGWNVHERRVVWLENNPQLTQLDDLAGIGPISSLVLIDNDGLSSVLSEGAFEKVELLRVVGNPELASLAGLENAVHLNQLEIGDNAALVDLSELESLEGIVEDLVVEGNEALESLDGLSGVASIGYSVDENRIGIYDNPSLADIGALSGISILHARLEVTGNSSLPSCAVKDLADYLEESTEWTGEGNVVEEDNLADECSDLI